MFSFLFGNKKKKVEPQLEPVVTTLNDLHSKEADLERRNEMLEAQIRAAGEAAVLANRAGQKQKALNLMQKRKMYEQQLETNNAAIMRLLMQRTTLESNNVNVDTFKVMEKANAAMKEQQRHINPEAVAELNETTHELMANQREINDMLKEPVGDMPSMADLEAELAELDGPVPVPETSKPVQALNFPAVPSAAIQTKTVRSKSVMEQQLAALEAL
jgi:hypothetical protein